MTQTSNVVIVTGAAGNLGRAVLAALSATGDSVVAVDREAGSISEALGAAGSADRHLALPGVDLGQETQCRDAVAATMARYGRIDGLVHTVGGFAAASVEASDAALWERMFTLNVITTVNMVGACLPSMRSAGRGSIVLIGAGAALRAPAGLAAYGASKSALLRLVESYADELKSDHIRINAVLPSIIDTPQNRAAMPGANHAAWVRPSQLAETIGFLLSDRADAVTGASIPVTGKV